MMRSLTTQGQLICLGTLVKSFVNDQLVPSRSARSGAPNFARHFSSGTSALAAAVTAEAAAACQQSAQRLAQPRRTERTPSQAARPQSNSRKDTMSNTPEKTAMTQAGGFAGIRFDRAGLSRSANLDRRAPAPGGVLPVDHFPPSRQFSRRTRGCNIAHQSNAQQST